MAPVRGGISQVTTTIHQARWDLVWISDVAEGGPEKHPPKCVCDGPVHLHYPDETIDHLQAICTDSGTVIAEACTVEAPCDCAV